MLLIFVLLGMLLALTSARHPHHIVIIDAGSTGSRVHVYAFTDRVRRKSRAKKLRINNSPLTVPTQLAEFATVPGISSFVRNPKGVAARLKLILDKAANALLQHSPGADLSAIPVYLGATAGMRILTDPQRDGIMKHVRDFLGGTGCPFAFDRWEQARVLSGEEEGAFGWLAANHHMQTLSSDPKVAFGALDMGGASTQVSFIPYATSVLANLFPMHIGQFATGPIHLYTHSFLRYGFATAFQSSALLASIGSSTFAHPCLPRGLIWRVDEGVFGISVSEETPERTRGAVTMSGSGSFGQCQMYARSLMVETFCTTLPCAILGVYRPSLNDTKFLAFSEFKDTFEAFNITAENTLAPLLQALNARLQTWCGMTLQAQAAVRHKQIGTHNADVELTCWKGVWVYELLVNGLGFPEDTRNIVLNDGAGGWAQGQAIYETSFFPYEIVETDTATAEVQQLPRDPPMLPGLAALVCACTTAVLVLGVAIGRRLERRAGQAKAVDGAPLLA